MSTSTINQNQVTLISREGNRISVDKDTISLSILVKDILEDGDEENAEIPVSNVRTEILTKVIQYCQYHKGKEILEIEKPLRKPLDQVVCDWDYKFIDKDNSTIVELIMAANYMNINSLMDLACAKISVIIKGKSPEQIRQIFGIENDFTPEEEQKIREENKWCE